MLDELQYLLFRFRAYLPQVYSDSAVPAQAMYPSQVRCLCAKLEIL